VLAVVLLAVAVAARKPLEQALSRLLGRNAGEAPAVVVKPRAQPEGGPEEDQGKGNGGSGPASPAPQGPAAGPSKPAGDTERVATNPPPEEKPPIRKTRLFFASVGENGRIVLKGVIRPIPATDSPLRDTILTLLAGPTSPEVNQGLLTMIPSAARLRSVTIRGGTAYIDLSESFRFTTLGREGLNAQLEQIVFAATEFPTVKRVQILIEGTRVQYLGPEGIRIDSPLTRASFGE
jgi:spore germination protein GerM